MIKKEEIIEVLKKFEQADHKRGGVSLAPEMYDVVAEHVVKLLEKKILTNLNKEAKEISKNNKKTGTYIQLSEDYIQQLANEQNVSFDVMVNILENKTKNNKIL